MKLLITAGPTREPIDAVRFIGNRSSGRMGAAVAEAGTSAGHDVTLLMGPTMLAPSLAETCDVIRFNTTAELEALLSDHFSSCDVLIMAAAVADYRPVTTTDIKLSRSGGGMTLQLEPTPDLVANIAAEKREDQRIIAYALEEPQVLESRATEKMKRKNVDAIIANALGTMEADGVEAVLLTKTGERIAPGWMTKADFAKWLVDWLETL